VLGILQSGSIVPRVLPFGWTFRDFLQSPKFIPMAGSIVGLLAVSSWVFGDASPFNVLSAVAQWLGIQIAGPLAHADAWLNAKPRHDGLAGATFIALFFATVRQAARLKNRYRNEEMEAAFDANERAAAIRRRDDSWIFKCDLHFWAVTWIIAGLLAQLHEETWVLAVSLVVILLWRAVADLCADRVHRRLGLRRDRARAQSGDVEPDQSTAAIDLAASLASVQQSLILAFGTLLTALGEVFALLTQPRMGPPKT
jgi:hypothetical protein